jgi:hypothetical protein
VGWIRRAARRVWHAIKKAAKAAWHVVRRVERLLGAGLGYIFHLVLSIPIVGRLLHWAWNIILTLVYLVFSVIDFVLTLFGLMLPKRMSLLVIIQRDEQGNPVATVQEVLPFIQEAQGTFKSQVNVNLVPADALNTTDNPFIFLEDGASDSNTLDTCCDDPKLCAALHDLWITGSAFEQKMMVDDSLDNGTRILGYASPVCAFAVRNAGAGDNGCSLGPLTDYVTVDFKDASNDQSSGNLLTLAHELGHACNLTHHGYWLDGWNSPPTYNLMNPTPANRGPYLNRFQKALLRSSRHVTFLGPII